ncbi:MAG: hypothetical protein ACE5LU_01580 [Anaerolineae bacterium]
MASLALTIPILPGKTEEFRAFVQEALGPRRAELDASGRKHGLDRQLIWVQPTPQGDVLIVYLEGDDPVKSNDSFVASQDPFDVWWKERIQAITGVDFNQPPPGLPELVFNWQA